LFGFNWLDIIVICILLFGILDGISKGFFLSFFNIAGIFLSLYVSRFLMGILANFLITNTSMYNGLKATFEKRISSIDFVSSSILKLFNIKGNNVANEMTTIFFDTACFILIFFITTVILNIFKGFLKSKIKKSSLRHIDKLLGGVIGFIVAAIFIFLLFALIIPITTVMSKNSSLVIAIETSEFAKYFFYFNFILPWLQKAHYIKSMSILIIDLLA
jgi:uncharacterized membrane protein required for colicin V production